MSTGTGVLMALPLPTLRLWAVSCLGTVAVTGAPASGREQPLPARGPSASPTRPSSRKVKELLCPAGSHRMVAPPSCPAFVSPSSSVALGAPGVRVRLAQPLTSCFLCGHLSPHLPLGTRLQLTGHLIRRRARCPPVPPQYPAHLSLVTHCMALSLSGPSPSHSLRVWAYLVLCPQRPGQSWTSPALHVLNEGRASLVTGQSPLHLSPLAAGGRGHGDGQPAAGAGRAPGREGVHAGEQGPAAPQPPPCVRPWPPPPRVPPSLTPEHPVLPG